MPYYHRADLIDANTDRRSAPRCQSGCRWCDDRIDLIDQVDGKRPVVNQVNSVNTVIAVVSPWRDEQTIAPYTVYQARRM